MHIHMYKCVCVVAMWCRNSIWFLYIYMKRFGVLFIGLWLLSFSIIRFEWVSVRRFVFFFVWLCFLPFSLVHFCSHLLYLCLSLPQAPCGVSLLHRVFCCVVLCMSLFHRVAPLLWMKHCFRYIENSKCTQMSDDIINTIIHHIDIFFIWRPQKSAQKIYIFFLFFAFAFNSFHRTKIEPTMCKKHTY